MGVRREIFRNWLSVLGVGLFPMIYLGPNLFVFLFFGLRLTLGASVVVLVVGYLLVTFVISCGIGVRDYRARLRLRPKAIPVGYEKQVFRTYVPEIDARQIPAKPQNDYYKVTGEVMRVLRLRSLRLQQSDLHMRFQEVLAFAGIPEADRPIAELVHYLLDQLGVDVGAVPKLTKQVQSSGGGSAETSPSQDILGRHGGGARPQLAATTICEVFDFLVELCKSSPASASWRRMAQQCVPMIACFARVPPDSYVRMSLQNLPALVDDMRKASESRLDTEIQLTLDRVWLDQRIAKGYGTYDYLPWLDEMISMDTHSRLKQMPGNIQGARTRFERDTQQFANQYERNQIQAARRIPTSAALLVRCLTPEESQQGLPLAPDDPRFTDFYAWTQWVQPSMVAVEACLHDDAVVNARQLLTGYRKSFPIPDIFPEPIALQLVWEAVLNQAFFLLTEGQWKKALALLRKGMPIFDKVFRWSSAQEPAIPFVAKFLKRLEQQEATDLGKALDGYKELLEVATDSATRNQVIAKIAEVSGRLAAQQPQGTPTTRQTVRRQRQVELACLQCGTTLSPSDKECPKCATPIPLCATCRLGIYHEQDFVGTPCCSVLAHRDHLLEWLHTHDSCPNCRASLKPSQLISDKEQILAKLAPAKKE